MKRLLAVFLTMGIFILVPFFINALLEIWEMSANLAKYCVDCFFDKFEDIKEHFKNIKNIRKDKK